MIKLQKKPQPQSLIDNGTNWRNEYLSYINNNITPPSHVAHRYNQKDIKETLELETHSKCAYCESKIKHIEFGDIEHILPKNKDACPELYVDWNNLTLACEICNRTNKKDYYDPNLPLINPYTDDPENHFIFLGPMITSQASDSRAFVTMSTLDLNRSDLVLKRNERLHSIEILYISWEQQNNPTIKNVLKNELIKECMPDKEYSAFVRHFLIAKGFPF